MGRDYRRIKVMYYRLFFKRNAKFAQALKIILLIVGLFCDCLVLLGLVFAILGAYYYLIMLFISLACSIVLRVIAVNLVYDIECKLDGGNLEISKLFPHKPKQILSQKLCDLKVEICADDSPLIGSTIYQNKKVIDLSTCKNERYVVEGKTQYVICNLDKYVYACILNGEEI